MKMTKHGYQYRPLEPNNIRVLSLQPDEADGIITCTVQHINLDESEQAWAALSYVWGDPKKTTSILLDGYQFKVTINLENFLRHLRARRARFNKKPIVCWADAICINQKDISERNSQVRLMTKIYQKASLVIGWLGPADADTEIAFYKMRNLQYLFTERAQMHLSDDALIDANGIRWWKQNKDIFDSIPSSHPEVCGILGSAEEQRPWMLLGNMFKRDWWERAWIVQESTTATPTVLMCGRFEILWDTLQVVSMFYLQLVTRPGFGVMQSWGFPRLASLTQFKLTRNEHGVVKSFISVLKHPRQFRATDARDHVYAATPMALDLDMTEFRIDYNLPVDEVYMDVVRHFISEITNLDWLQYGGVRSQERSDLPHWVPDWSISIPWGELPKTMPDGKGGKTQVYAASGPLPNPTYPPATIRGRQLHLTGILVNRIAVLHNPSQSSWNPQVEKSWTPSNLDDLYLATGETIRDAFLRTLECDVVEYSSSPISRDSRLDWPATSQDPVDLLVRGMTKSLTDGRPRTCMKRMTKGKRFIVTERGYMGLVPEHAQRGDYVCVLGGGQVLYVLRERRGLPRSFDPSAAFHCYYMGECYLHGFMDGEALVDRALDFRTIVFQGNELQKTIFEWNEELGRRKRMFYSLWPSWVNWANLTSCLKFFLAMVLLVLLVKQHMVYRSELAQPIVPQVKIRSRRTASTKPRSKTSVPRHNEL